MEALPLLPVSLSPYLPISLSPYLPISLSPSLTFSPPPTISSKRYDNIPVTNYHRRKTLSH